MSNAPTTINGIDVSFIDWHGPMVEIIDELVSLRMFQYVTKNGGYITEGQSDEAYEWGDKYATKYADSLHPHLEGKV